MPYYPFYFAKLNLFNIILLCDDTNSRVDQHLCEDSIPWHQPFAKCSVMNISVPAGRTFRLQDSKSASFLQTNP